MVANEKLFKGEEMSKKDRQLERRGRPSEVFKKVITIPEAIYTICNFRTATYVYRGSDGFIAAHYDATYY